MRFTKLHAEFWNNRASRAIKAAGPQGLQTYLYLQSCPMGNYLGLYYLNLDQASLDLGMTAESIMGYVEKFIAAGFMKWDAENEMLWIVDAAADNIGELPVKDLRVKAVKKDFATVPKKSPLRAEFYAKYATMLHLDPESFQGSQEQTVAKAITPSNTLMVELDAVIKLLVLRRSMNRAEYPETGDSYVAVDANQLCDEVGAKEATARIMQAIVTGDLELFEAMKRTVSGAADRGADEITEVEADI